jgi:hypothetical protein
MLMDVVGVLEAWICNRGALGMAAIPLDTPEYSLIPPQCRVHWRE